MTSKFLLAGVSASLLFGAAHAAMAADAKGPKATPAVYKQLVAAQTATTKKDFPAALAAIEAAKAVSDRSPYDNYMIARFSSSIHIGMKDLDAAEPEAEAAADADPALIPDTEKGGVYNTAMQLAMRAKLNEKAAKYAKLYLATTPPPTGPDLQNATQALLFGGDEAGAIAIAQKNIDAAIAAGQKPSRNDFDVIITAQIRKKDEVGAEKTLEQLVANYNMPEDWSQIMSITFTAKGMRDMDYVYMGRLMLARGGQINQSDAQLVGSAANSNRLGLYGDAEAMQKFGGPAPDPRAVADKKSMPAQIAAGPKSNGEYNVKAAEAAFGYGMYPEAESLARAAKTKGGVQDATEPDMVLGMAQAAQNKYADAAQTFAGINQSNPASARVVRLWTYFAKTKASTATATAN
jgi:hypothetical protein